MPGGSKKGGGLKTKKSPFYLKSGNTTSFKNMGNSPLNQEFIPHFGLLAKASEGQVKEDISENRDVLRKQAIDIVNKKDKTSFGKRDRYKREVIQYKKIDKDDYYIYPEEEYSISNPGTRFRKVHHSSSEYITDGTYTHPSGLSDHDMEKTEQVPTEFGRKYKKVYSDLRAGDRGIEDSEYIPKDE